MHYETISPLLAHGFQVFTFDYSGYGYSEGKSTRKDVLKDAYSALDFVIASYKQKDMQLAIYGHSYGGYLASVVGSNRQKDIDALVLEGAFSAHKEEANYKVPILGYLVKNEEIAAEEIQKNNKPLLIIHSSEDKKVPMKFGKKIYKKANQPKEFFEIEKGHILGLQYYTDEIADKIKLMLNQK
jgi:alpha-beta hydrolase superfamily lysophospholipase